MTKKQTSNRRDFMQTSGKIVAVSAAAAAVSPSLSIARSAHAFGSDTVKIGLIGCGGRGTGAAIQAMNTKSGNVELVAMADAFQNRLDNSHKSCNKRHGEKVTCVDETKHVGFDGYKNVLGSDADLVILATPPAFRPLHFEAAIKAGKHVFMEKPVAVDAPGVRRVLEANRIAKEKGLAVQVGLQRRHERAYRETIERLQNGAIGDLIASRVYWNSGGVWVRGRRPEQSELEYQMTNWYYFNWICGDHIVEQHIHNLDVINWMLDDFPVSAQGMGGRLVRTGKDHGQIFDHHAVEYTYKNGHKMFSCCRHMPETWGQVSEHVHGSNGHANVSGARLFEKSGKQIFHSKAGRGGHQQEHHDLFADLRNGIVPNEGDYGAKSTMTSILGRLATYTGKNLKWEDAINSNISLANVDAFQNMNDEAPVQPDEQGRYPIPQPGKKIEGVIDWKA